MKRNFLLFLVAAAALALSACTPAATIVPTIQATESVSITIAPPTATVTPAATATPEATATTVAQTSAEAGPVTVKNDDGSDFSLEQPAQQVISLAPSNTEILFAIGAGDQVIGREDFSNYPEAANEIPSIGGSMGKYNLEEITRLQPDLLLASPLTSADMLQALQGLGLPVYVVPNPTDLEGMYANLKTVGTLTGHEPEAEALVNDLTARVSAVEEKMQGVTASPKVFYELDATDPAKPWTSGPGTFMDTLISMAGGQNVGAKLSGDFAQMSQEALIVENPDIILLGDALYGGITPEQVAQRPGWDGIKAVQKQQVLTFNDDLVSRPGPRLVDGLEELAKILHPELY